MEDFKCKFKVGDKVEIISLDNIKFSQELINNEANQEQKL